MLAILLVALGSTRALAQTAEDAHVQHDGQQADAALNAQYRRTMAAMTRADQAREDALKEGDARPDGRPTYVAGLLAAERAWLAYRDAHCTTVGLTYRGGAYQDETEGKCIADMARKRALELKQLSDTMAE